MRIRAHGRNIGRRAVVKLSAGTIEVRGGLGRKVLDPQCTKSAGELLIHLSSTQLRARRH